MRFRNISSPDTVKEYLNVFSDFTSSGSFAVFKASRDEPRIFEKRKGVSRYLIEGKIEWTAVVIVANILKLSSESSN